MKQSFRVTGMTCSACAARVEKTVRAVSGVQQVSVNLLTNRMTATFDTTTCSSTDIISAVTAAGYGAFPADQPQAPQKSQPQDALRQQRSRMCWSFVLLLPLMYLAMGPMLGIPLPPFLNGTQKTVSYALAQFLLCLPVVWMNSGYYQRGFRAIRHGAPNMDTLIAIGSSASLLYGVLSLFRMSSALGTGDLQLLDQLRHDLYFESAVMILAFVNLGKYLEARAKGKTGAAIQKLMDLSPKTAWVERDGVLTELPVGQVAVGDLLHIKPGATIPVDGVITEGITAVDESAITGESLPVEKEIGDSVTGATINQGSFFKMRATHVGDDTTLSAIIHLVEEANADKAPIAKLADRIAGVFVPIVLGISLLTLVGWLLAGAGFSFALSCSIAVLVISCPCALGLATPVSIMVGTGKGAEHGILIKSGEALETAHRIHCVVMDKTGTLTTGKPQITDVLPLTVSKEQLLGIAAALEAGSEHPIAGAVMAAAPTSLPTATESVNYPGRGVSAVVDGKRYYAGNTRLLAEHQIATASRSDTVSALAEAGKTPLFIADSETVCGILAVADPVKPTGAAAIAKLHAMGLEVWMLTGDNAATARHIQAQTGVDHVIAQVLPQDKEREIANLQKQGKQVAMVGDGINDAPALARADVGIAIGAGTDIAIESADIVLMRSDPADVSTAIHLSRAVLRNIRENLFWAFIYNTCGIPLAAGLLYPLFGLRLSPMIGAAAMSLSSVFVVSNALRLRFWRPQTAKKTADKHSMKQEEKQMITMKIEGMMCEHCKAAVEKALNALDGVHAEVHLAQGEAVVQGAVSPEALKQAVTDAGYTVTEIK